MALAYMATAPLSAFVNATPNRKLLGYKYREQIMDMFPSMLLSFIMAVAVLMVGYIRINLFLTLLIQIIVGVLVYFCGAVLFKIDSLNYILKIIKKD